MESEEAAIALHDEFLYLHEHPLYWTDLNSKKLNTIPLLTVTERDSLLTIRSRLPDPESWESVEKYFSPDVMEILRYLVLLGQEQPVAGEIRWRGKSTDPADLQSYTRFRLSQKGRYTSGIVLERDQGESSITDQIAGGIELHNVPYLDKVLLGGFRIGYGSGLAFGTSMGLSKSSSAVGNVDRNGTRLRVNESSLESAGFTGVAIQENWGNHHFQVAGAYSLRDGEWDGQQLVLSKSGLHTTERSALRANRVGEELLTGAYWFKSKGRIIGFQGSGISYQDRRSEKPIRRDKTRSVWLQTDNFQHETALDASDNRAHFSSLRRDISFAEFVVAHRWYAPTYRAEYAGGFGEYHGTSNEEGWYIGMESKLGDTRWYWYFDAFHEIEGTSNPPGSGTEWLLRCDWRPRSRMLITGYIKTESKEIPFTQSANGVVHITNLLREKRHYRAEWRYRWESGRTITVKTDYIVTDYSERQITGSQWAYRLTFPWRKRNRYQVFLVPYNVADSEASTYYFVMPVYGTMQLMRQTGSGLLFGHQLRIQMSDQAEITIFHLQRQEERSILYSVLAVQMDIAF
ncbi:MAG: hypothetical protein K9N53_07745 [Candidatus Marinimicrobia bacterium]|nr:hypothetical protein [Candidatus Neomarinimicrobiota bacterium]MCF7828851.1 hypothetical protein [Candidatus Neomarinimicrobiota bacterium]